MCQVLTPTPPKNVGLFKVRQWLEGYTLFQNGHLSSVLLFPCKLTLFASLSNVKFKRICNLEQGQKGQFAIKQKNTKNGSHFEIRSIRELF